MPSIAVRTATELARTPFAEPPSSDPAEIEVLDLRPDAPRPFGPHFGTLVHATLATVPLDADDGAIERVARTQGRLLVAKDEEVAAAAQAVGRALRHSLFDRARAAAAAGRLSREVPVIWTSEEAVLVEGTVDLVFHDADHLVVVDFKTDRDPLDDVEPYRRQLEIYCRALGGAERAARAILVRI